MTRRGEAEKGFSLIELLTVIAIVGLLTAILIPNLLNALNKAKQKRTMADIRNLASAVEQYQSDFSLLPAADCASGFYTIIGPTFDVSSFTLLRPTYLSTPVYQDGWAHLLHYSNNGSSFSIASLGKNNVAEGVVCGTTTEFNADIVFADGQFIQWPEGAQQ